MGTDIHGHVEYYDNNQQQWKKVHMYRANKNHGTIEEVDPYPYRNYEMFGILAGVRGWHDPIIDPRGIPFDCSFDVREIWDREKDDCYSPSWYTLAELGVAAHDKKNFTKEERENIKLLIDFISFMVDASYIYAEPHEVRFVFWFDC